MFNNFNDLLSYTTITLKEFIFVLLLPVMCFLYLNFTLKSSVFVISLPYILSFLCLGYITIIAHNIMIKHNKRYQEKTKEYKYPAYLFPNIFFVMFICYNFYSTYNDLKNNDSLQNSSTIQTDLNIKKFKSPSENSVNTLSNNDKESQHYNIKKFKFDERKNEYFGK